MHIANFGWFASAERNLVFGINDFDETLPGAWEWDLKRLAASAIVAARFMGADKVLVDDKHRIVEDKPMPTRPTATTRPWPRPPRGSGFAWQIPLDGTERPHSSRR